MLLCMSTVFILNSMSESDILKLQKLYCKRSVSRWNSNWVNEVELAKIKESNVKFIDIQIYENWNKITFNVI